MRGGASPRGNRGRSVRGRGGEQRGWRQPEPGSAETRGARLLVQLAPADIFFLSHYPRTDFLHSHNFSTERRVSVGMWTLRRRSRWRWYDVESLPCSSWPEFCSLRGISVKNKSWKNVLKSVQTQYQLGLTSSLSPRQPTTGPGVSCPPPVTWRSCSWPTSPWPSSTAPGSNPTC